MIIDTAAENQYLKVEINELSLISYLGHAKVDVK